MRAPARIPGVHVLLPVARSETRTGNVIRNKDVRDWQQRATSRQLLSCRSRHGCLLPTAQSVNHATRSAPRRLAMGTPGNAGWTRTCASRCTSAHGTSNWYDLAGAPRRRLSEARVVDL